VTDHTPATDNSGPAQRYSTEPPDVATPSLKRRIGELASRAIMPLIKRAARPYLGGESIDDALCVSERLMTEGFATALSYWDGGSESLDEMETLSLAAIGALSEKVKSGFPSENATNKEFRAMAMGQSYLALKPPSLRFSPEAARKLAAAAARHRLRLHFDSHGADVVDRQNAMLEVMLGTLGSALLGTTLPGRLHRTLDDADWAVAHGLNVRVVKGEWPDPADPKRDLRAGFLEVIDRLAGRARHVAVATHDFTLGCEAITRLKAAGTSCEVEVLLGMPAAPLLTWAKNSGVTVRIYVPYGCGFIPNAVGVLRRNPRLGLAIAKAQLNQFAALFSSHRHKL